MPTITMNGVTTTGRPTALVILCAANVVRAEPFDSQRETGRPHLSGRVGAGVDRENAGRAHDNVVDVGATRTGGNAVDDPPFVAELLELLGNDDLTEGTEIPAVGVRCEGRDAEELLDTGQRKNLALQGQALLDGRIARTACGQSELYSSTCVGRLHLSPTVRLGAAPWMRQPQNGSRRRSPQSGKSVIAGTPVG
jgi:hypothetical protein